MSDGGAQLKIISLGSDFAGGSIDSYEAGNFGTTKNIWNDETKSSAITSISADTRGVVSFYGDGDYWLRVKDSKGNLLYDWPFYKITSDTATMWEGNIGTSYPSATSANVGHLFAKVDGSNNLQNIGFNNGTSFGDTLNGVNANSYTSLNSAVSAIGATETELIITSQVSVTGPVTVPQTISLNFARSGSIDQDVHAVTINGSVKAGLYKIFDGTETIIFGDSSIVEVYPQWWGALGDNSNDDTTGIQRAIDSMVIAKSGIIRFVKGIYLINAPLTIDNSGVRLLGTTLLGRQAITTDSGVCEIREGGSFSGNTLIHFDSLTRNFYNEIGNLKLSADSAGVACVRDNASLTGGIISCYFHDLQIEAIYGFITAYVQSCTWDNIICNTTIAMESIIYCNGTFHDNIIRRINKAGDNSGATDTTDHIGYITLKKNAGASGNPQGSSIEQIVFENSSVSGKAGIYLEGSNIVTIYNYWNEIAGASYLLYTKDSARPSILYGKYSSSWNEATSTGSKIKLENAQLIMRDLQGDENLVDNDTSPNLWDLIDADSTSSVIIESMFTNRGDDLIRCSNPEIQINSVYKVTADESAYNFSPVMTQRYLSGENMFINPSFEAGEWGWSWTGNTPNTKSFESSQLGYGLMAHYTWDTNVPSASRVKQRIANVVPASWSGQWITISFKVKMVKGGGNTAAAWGSAWIQGGGMVGPSGESGRVNAGEGWSICSATFKITTTGSTLDAGFYFESGEQDDEVYLDDFSLTFGFSNSVASNKFGSIELSGSDNQGGTQNRLTYSTITKSSDIPTSGTWKVGDIIFDNVPTSGGEIGWVCITAGTPGTWKSWGVIS